MSLRTAHRTRRGNFLKKYLCLENVNLSTYLNKNVNVDKNVEVKLLAYRKYLKFWFMYFDIEGHSILDVRVGQPSNGSCPGK